MKILMSTGGGDLGEHRVFPNHDLGICVEAWGNVLCELGDLYWTPSKDFAVNANVYADEYDLLFVELLPYQWVGLSNIRANKKCKVIGVSHAPPHNIEVETAERKLLFYRAMKRVDYVFMQDYGISNYKYVFGFDALNLFKYPHPLPTSIIQKPPKVGKKKQKAMMFHRMDIGSHDFDFFLTLSILAKSGLTTEVFISENEIEKAMLVLGEMDLLTSVNLVANQHEFEQMLSECLVSMQISARPSLGRTVPASILQGTIPISNGYMYQDVLMKAFSVCGNKMIETMYATVCDIKSISTSAYSNCILTGYQKCLEYTVKAYIDRLYNVFKMFGNTNAMME